MSRKVCNKVPGIIIITACKYKVSCVCQRGIKKERWQCVRQSINSTPVGQEVDNEGKSHQCCQLLIELGCLKKLKIYRICLTSEINTYVKEGKQPFKTFGHFVAFNVKNQPKFGHRLIRPPNFYSFLYLVTLPKNWPVSISNTEAYSFVNKRIWERICPLWGGWGSTRWEK